MTHTLDLAALKKQYDELKAKNLDLNLTRGKPSTEQLDFSNALLSLPEQGKIKDKTGADVRNYGNLRGIEDIREIWAELLGVGLDNIIAGDSSSLNIQFDIISWTYIFGNQDSPKPWSQEEDLKWLCPVPGYDRHFTITQKFGFEMIPVPMHEDGPDMDAVRELVKDPAVKGMWCVPMFSNPGGQTYSEKVCRELAEMETAAPDFRIFWDNAYAIHILRGDFPPVYPVLDYAAEAGHPNRFNIFASTSKITLAGSGVSFYASSTENLDFWASVAKVRGIGPNKVNQLAHAQFFTDAEGVRNHMKKHVASLAPKFDKVVSILEDRLGEYGVASWTNPDGGYFISLDVVDGTASRVVELAKEAGIALTGAGSSFPLHKDPNDRNIRLSPSLPPIDELEQAMEGVATCVLLAAAEKQAQA